VKKNTHESMKLGNQLLILRTIRDMGPVTRVKLQKESKLSWGTVTASVKSLVDRRIAKEIGSVHTGVGRRPVELDMNAERNFALGLRLGSTYIRSLLMDVKGRVVGDLKMSIDATGSKEVVLGQLFEAAQGVLDKSSIKTKEVAGIGVAAPGAIDASSGVCLYAPHHPNLKDVPIKQAFEDRFKTPCFVDHVNNCSALAERWFGLGKGTDNFLCVLLGTGISAGIIINGQVYRGVNSTSGEFGHTSIDVDGPKCACGCNGCLEAFASGPALARMGVEAVRRSDSQKILSLAGGEVENISGDTIYLAAKEEDEAALKIFSEMGHFLGIGISNLIDLFNPDCVILSGRVSLASEFFLPALRRTVEERAWHASRKEIRVSQLENGAVLGAAGMVLQEIYDRGLLLDHSRSKGLRSTKRSSGKEIAGWRAPGAETERAILRAGSI
jgi:N-acetylglucosamine repressor